MGFQQPLLIRNHCLLSLSRIFSGCGLEMVCKSARKEWVGEYSDTDGTSTSQPLEVQYYRDRAAGNL